MHYLIAIIIIRSNNQTQEITTHEHITSKYKDWDWQESIACTRTLGGQHHTHRRYTLYDNVTAARTDVGDVGATNSGGVNSSLRLGHIFCNIFIALDTFSFSL